MINKNLIAIRRVDVSVTELIKNILDSAPQYSLNIEGVEKPYVGIKVKSFAIVMRKRL